MTPGCNTTDVLSDTLNGPGLVYLGTEVVDALVAVLGLPAAAHID